jgi:hypothetical protein
LESLREQLDDLLSRLGQGQDATVLLGAAIGSERVSVSVARIPAEQRDPFLVQQLSGLAARYHRLCRLLRQAALAILGVAVALAAIVGVGAPALAAFSAAALVTVMAAAVVLGRDHTGATDLPGHTRGVGILIGRLGDVRA